MFLNKCNIDSTIKFANYVYQSEISMLLIKYFTHQEASPKGEEEYLSHQIPPPAHPIQPLPSRPPPPRAGTLPLSLPPGRRIHLNTQAIPESTHMAHT